MIRIAIKVFVLLALLAVLIVSFLNGHLVSASHQLEIYKIVITLAAIIFGIMGAWLSLIKVEIINGIENSKTNEESDMYIGKVRDLISPMTSSAIILIASLIYVFSYYFLRSFSIDTDTIFIFRKLSFTLLTGLCIWQLYALTSVLVSGVVFVLDISRLNADLSADRKRRNGS